jgi:hypothetical protein
MPKGGTRQGAGRPKTGRVNKGINMVPERWHQLLVLSERANISQAELMEHLILKAMSEAG